MVRKLSSFGVTLLLVGAALVTTPTFAFAQHGGHGGMGHVGPSFGAPRGVGGFRGGFHNYGYGGYRYGYRGYYPYYYGGLGYYSPYYSGAYTYAPSYDVTPDYAPPATGITQSMYPPSPTTQVVVNVPSDAQVWFNDTLMTTTGVSRQFVTPALNPGTEYSYVIKAQWTENGHDVTQSQTVKFNPGGQVIVNFPIASPPTEAIPAPLKK